MRREKYLNDHQEEWAYYWWNRGYTMNEIAEALWVSKATVNRAIERKRQENQKWYREKPPLKYDENWRIEK